MKRLKTKIKNFCFCLKYPFLKPKNYWSNKTLARYDYSYTTYDELPDGWKKAFGENFINELSQAIKKDHLKSFAVLGFKTKFGVLCISTNTHTDNIDEIIDKYEMMSKEFCMICGKPIEPTRKNTRASLYACEECMKTQIK